MQGRVIFAYIAAVQHTAAHIEVEAADPYLGRLLLSPASLRVTMAMGGTSFSRPRSCSMTLRSSMILALMSVGRSCKQHVQVSCCLAWILHDACHHLWHAGWPRYHSIASTFTPVSSTVHDSCCCTSIRELIPYISATGELKGESRHLVGDKQWSVSSNKPNKIVTAARVTSNARQSFLLQLAS